MRFKMMYVALLLFAPAVSLATPPAKAPPTDCAPWLLFKTSRVQLADGMLEEKSYASGFERQSAEFGGGLTWDELATFFKDNGRELDTVLKSPAFDPTAYIRILHLGVQVTLNWLETQKLPARSDVKLTMLAHELLVKTLNRKMAVRLEQTGQTIDDDLGLELLVIQRKFSDVYPRFVAGELAKLILDQEPRLGPKLSAQDHSLLFYASLGERAMNIHNFPTEEGLRSEIYDDFLHSLEGKTPDEVLFSINWLLDHTLGQVRPGELSLNELKFAGKIADLLPGSVALKAHQIQMPLYLRLHFGQLSSSDFTSDAIQRLSLPFVLNEAVRN